MNEVTVFVSTFNRTDTLEKCLRSLRSQTARPRIVIVDNGTDYPPAVRYLEHLSQSHTVYTLPRVFSMDQLTRNISKALRAEWQSQKRPRWYAVTDADIRLDRSGCISTYIQLARTTGFAVGPHLRPNPHVNYPLRTFVLVQQSAHLYRQLMTWEGKIPYSRLPIDTTFHLFRATKTFRRLKMETVRVGPPWWATHMDWGINLLRPSREHMSYMRSTGPTGSYGGGWIKELYNAFRFDPEQAFLATATSEKKYDDYFLDGFMTSWMLQYGHGCAIDVGRSYAALQNAIPTWSPCWKHEDDWRSIVYDNDLECLGWGRRAP